MRRYLIVGNQTLLSDALVSKLGELVAEGPCELYLVVPATHVAEHMVWTEGHDRAVAAERLHTALDSYHALGGFAEGEVGDASAIQAVRDALQHQHGFDEIIVSTLPLGMSRWLHQDLPHRVARTFGLPTTTVVSVLTAA